METKETITKVREFLSKQDSVNCIFLPQKSKKDQEDDKLLIFVIVSIHEQVESIMKLLEFSFSADVCSLIRVNSIEELSRNNPALQRIFKEGKIIYWNAEGEGIPVSQLFNLKIYTLFTFELTQLHQNLKAQFNYKLYGRHASGMLEDWQGIRLTKSCFCVPYHNKYKTIRFFKKSAINYKDKEIWM